MADIYFIRHAQSGTREDYDRLSELGKQQAQLLGEQLVAQGIEFGAIYSGGMRRQRETAEIARDVMRSTWHDVPDVSIDQRWNEFGLLSVYREIAKHMISENAAFARDIKEMKDALARDPHTTGGAVGRCDRAVIRAWMENRYSGCEGESWASFRSRIHECAVALPSNRDAEKAIAVFTSATPIAIVAGAALELTEEKFLSILGVIYNSGITILRSGKQGFRLFTFNSTPHLDVSKRTLR